MNLALWRRMASWMLYQLGVVGGLAVVSIIGALLFAAAATWPAHQRVVELRQAWAVVPEPVVTPVSPESQRSAFVAKLPSAEALPDVLQKIFLAAQKHDLPLDTGDYELRRETAAQLTQLHIKFPVHGTYPQIREFLAAALKDVPALALESTTFRREHITEGSVDAEISFSLMLGHES
jgi:hypothetical protein